MTSRYSLILALLWAIWPLLGFANEDCEMELSTPFPYRVELNSTALNIGKRPPTQRLNAHGQSHPTQYRFDLSVVDSEGNALLNRTFQVKPQVRISSTGHFAIKSRCGPSGQGCLEVFRFVRGKLRRIQKIGSTGFWGLGESSVSAFSWHPEGERLIYTVLKSEQNRGGGASPFPSPRVNTYRTYFLDVLSKRKRELLYKHPQRLQDGFYTHGEFVWSPAGKYVGFWGRGANYFFIFEAETGKHLETYQIREVINDFEKGVVDITGIDGRGNPVYEHIWESTQGFAPLPIGPVIPTGN